MDRMKLSGREVVCFPPENTALQGNWPMVIIHGDEKTLDLLVDNKLLPMNECFAAVILSEDRLADYTPWESKALNERFPDFSGKADEYLAWICEQLLDKMKAEYSIAGTADKIGMLGQSLGGLLNLYSYISEYNHFYEYLACISPSSWYPGFVEAFERRITSKSKKEWYISSGTKEGLGHNDIKKDTVELTKKLLYLLKQKEHKAIEYWDCGTHHEFLAERYRNALSWLDKNLL